MAGLGQLGGWVDAIAGTLGLASAAEYALRLCLEEAASNVVMHGEADANGADGAGADGTSAGFVALWVEPDREVLRVTLEDRCGAFDPLDVPAPDLPTTLEDARVGGLGVHLMRQYARAISYERVGDVNRLMLVIGR